MEYNVVISCIYLCGETCPMQEVPTSAPWNQRPQAIDTTTPYEGWFCLDRNINMLEEISSWKGEDSPLVN